MLTAGLVAILSAALVAQADPSGVFGGVGESFLHLDPILIHSSSSMS